MPDSVLDDGRAPIAHEGGTKTYDLFLSHASGNVALAERLRAALTERGHSVWLDHTQLTAGTQWVAGIEAGLQGCRAFVLIATREAMASRFVQTEYSVAVDLAHDPERSLPLLPLLFENVKLPLILRSFQYVDFRRQEEFSQRVDESLVRSLQPAPPEPPRRIQQWPLAATTKRTPL